MKISIYYVYIESWTLGYSINSESYICKIAFAGSSFLSLADIKREYAFKILKVAYSVFGWFTWLFINSLYSLIANSYLFFLKATDMQTFYGNIKFGPGGQNVAKPMILFQVRCKGDTCENKVVAPTKWASDKFYHPIPKVAA